MGKCKIDPNSPKGAKCLKRFTVKCVGKECKNYAETNFERITASPEALAPHLIRYDDWDAYAPFIAADGENYVAEEEAIEATVYWLNQPAEEGQK